MKLKPTVAVICLAFSFTISSIAFSQESIQEPPNVQNSNSEPKLEIDPRIAYEEYKDGRTMFRLGVPIIIVSTLTMIPFSVYAIIVNEIILLPTLGAGVLLDTLGIILAVKGKRRMNRYKNHTGLRLSVNQKQNTAPNNSSFSFQGVGVVKDSMQRVRGLGASFAF